MPIKKPPNQELSMLLQLNHGILMFNNQNLMEPLPTNSKNRYLGIWFKKISTGKVVWVANREVPLHDKTGLTIQWHNF
ncbi:hypothetical protein L2E82_08030 [Cichorium intybus]|uniref:Uncharacterized protein n=1 Tax=Cichorium intybus TaxID=13427 RepID=A0ACB9G623_CICIN|nr:hypothetical protein L2E82_08030 [Cichorium intybus]